MSEGGNNLRLGNHSFTISRHPLELTLVPNGDGLAYHLTGTDYLVPVVDAALDAYKPYWQQALPSETAATYRQSPGLTALEAIRTLPPVQTPKPSIL